MSDLRGKLFMILAEYGRGYDHGTDATFAAADRILALLPKMPELRWLCDQLFLGNLRVGQVEEDRNGQMRLYAGEKIIGGAMPMDVARDAVEAAVRKALGWKA